MKLILDQFILKTNKLDKILIVLIFFFPLLLSLTIFIADLFASLVATIILFLLISKKETSIFTEIKKQIQLFLIFYFLILISLFFSISFKESFLPSFFYFRYFLFTLAIFYLLKKYVFFCKIFLYSVCFTFLVVLLDSIYQFFFLKNFFNYQSNFDGTMYILTSFFNDEKKLGSYLVRILPLLISILYFFNFSKLNYFFLTLVGIIIFFTSERTALFLFVILSMSYFLIIKKKIYFSISGLLILLTLFILNPGFKFKYLNYTLMQFGFIETFWNKNYNSNIYYYSKEHEDLSYTAFQIFKKKIFTGSGVKTFYKACNNLKQEILDRPLQPNNIKKLNLNKNSDSLKRQNVLQCSTHPHNIYLQILSDTGIFVFIFVILFFTYILKKNISILLKKNNNNIDLCFYFLNVGIILNLFPFIPSGNFYNNWMSLILFYPLGFWLFINQKINRDE